MEVVRNRKLGKKILISEVWTKRRASKNAPTADNHKWNVASKSIRENCPTYFSFFRPTVYRISWTLTLVFRAVNITSRQGRIIERTKMQNSTKTKERIKEWEHDRQRYKFDARLTSHELARKRSEDTANWEGIRTYVWIWKVSWRLFSPLIKGGGLDQRNSCTSRVTCIHRATVFPSLLPMTEVRCEEHSYLWG